MNITALSSWVMMIAETLESYNVDYRPVFEELGMNVKELGDPNARYDHSAVLKLWSLVTDLTGDPCFGLKTRHFYRPTSLHALGFSWLASPTLLEAFNRLQRYVRIVNTAAKIQIDKKASFTQLTVSTSIAHIDKYPAAIDTGLSIVLHMCRLIYGNDLQPIKVQMRRPQPAQMHLKKYLELFGAPIEFGHNNNALFFDNAVVNRRLPTGNIELARANDQVINNYLSHLDDTSTGIRVKTKITELLPTGNVTEEKIASVLNVSLRTMQRKLKEENTSFKNILNTTRQELADHYMELSRMSLNEITYLLGFSDPANFSRAFKRWHGIPPSEYRNNLEVS